MAVSLRKSMCTSFNPDKVPKLIEVMKIRNVNIDDIFSILEITAPKKTKNICTRIIGYLSIHYPIYDVKYGVYGLLTDKLLDKTEEEELQRRRRIKKC